MIKGYFDSKLRLWVLSLGYGEYVAHASLVEALRLYAEARKADMA